MDAALQLRGESFRLALLVLSHVGLCCISLICVALIYPHYHFVFYPQQLLVATAMVLPMAALSLLFATAPFTFGYSVSFSLYTMLLGYVWLNVFSELPYDHLLAFVSTLAASTAFLFPALFIGSPVRQLYVLSPSALDRLLLFVFALAIAIIVMGSSYNFRFIDIEHIYAFRDQIVFPKALSYGIGITSSTLLPFAFACFIERGQRLRAALVLLLLACFYPITLTKLAFFAPVWLLLLVIAFRFFGARTTCLLSVFGPMLIGLLLFPLVRSDTALTGPAASYFYVINLRMFAIPSLAMDYYGYFFSNHPLTYYCQIGVVKAAWGCPYQAPLAIVIYNYFGIGGNLNASLFATEGIASVGPVFAPVAALVGGLVVAVANRLSSGLPPRFVLVSSGMMPQLLLNVPLSIALVTYGAAVLFLLWYLMPSSFLESKQ
ncbi:MAG: hypothetical protein HY852_05600 [Bradyrhizobium sp.]|uniref:hypothetical protein n=1 Tax=Bradyrhizobium sp. TaxID=376 RepID=UPI0025BBE9D3|nr:hypothetical protein [Bradyrhizobium sp.]MBI5261278.1 hypothetical protein [Bradyrhizobium sp.]